jgi:hypothetical protein
LKNRNEIGYDRINMVGVQKSILQNGAIVRHRYTSFLNQLLPRRSARTGSKILFGESNNSQTYAK